MLCIKLFNFTRVNDLVSIKKPNRIVKMTFIPNEPRLGIGLIAKKLGIFTKRLTIAIGKCINKPAKQINLTICML